MSQQLLNYARLVRLPNVFTAMADIGMATLITGALLNSPLRVGLLLFSSSFLYLAGMVWNDYFDIAQDKKERPFRPLPSGKISTRSAFTLGCLLMVLGLGSAVAADWGDDGLRWFSLPWALCLAVAILLYDGWLKRTWAGPVAMGTCRFFNVLLGLSAAAEPIPQFGWMLAAVVGLYIVGVTWFARTEARDSNKQMLRAAWSVIIGSLVLGLTVPALARQETPGLEVFPGFTYLLVAFGFYTGIPIARAIRRPRPEYVQRAVKRSVLGLVILDTILASALAGLPALGLVLLLVPAAYLGKWIYST